MNYRIVLGYVAGGALLVSLLFAWDSAWELLTNAGKFDLSELLAWLSGSVLVLAVSVLVMLIDYALERATKTRA